MLPLSRPPCILVASGRYHCPDIRTLYHWLEAHGYHYSGSFGADEYGRFVRKERALSDAEPVEHCSAIEVSLNGTVVAGDDHAQQLLTATLTNVIG